MTTFVQVLRLAFWVHPLQRLLTCLGVGLIVVSNFDVFTHARFVPSRFPAFPLGVLLVSAASLLLGGVYWRIASAPRIVSLAPHGRRRLLVAVIGLLLVLVLLSSLRYLSLLWREDALTIIRGTYPGPLLNVVGATPAFMASVVLIGLFIASRSPLAALVALIVLMSPVMSLVLFDVNFVSYMSPGRSAVAQLALIWIPFTIWYLRTRRISPPGWLAGGANDVLATIVVSSTAPKSRSEALQRQLLGGTTVIRFGTQWFVIIGLLLGLQWLLAGLGDTDPALSAPIMYASLCISPVVTTVFSFAAIRRSRTLWLLSESARSEFFASIERILIRLNLAMALGFAVWMAVLWFTQWWRPGAAEDQVAKALFQLMSLWLLGTLAIYAQFAGWPKWPVAVIAAGMLILLWWLTSLPETTPRQGAVTGLTATGLLIAASVTYIVLRWQAQRRWCEGDFPRAATSTASGT